MIRKKRALKSELRLVDRRKDNCQWKDVGIESGTSGDIECRRLEFSSLWVDFFVT